MSYLCNWQRRMCYIFPEIQLWCDTCLLLGNHHANPAILFHIPHSRNWQAQDRDLLCCNSQCETRQADILLTELCRLSLNIKHYSHLCINWLRDFNWNQQHIATQGSLKSQSIFQSMGISTDGKARDCKNNKWTPEYQGYRTLLNSGRTA